MKNFSDILLGIIAICITIALGSFCLTTAIFLWRNFT